AAYAANAAANFDFAAGKFAFDILETDQFYYFQDDIRVRANLTLNLGIRYENYGQPVNNLHDESCAREADPSTAFWDTSLPVEQRCFPKVARDDNNWAPRVGFAYTPRWGKAFFGEDRTVIRGGYGIAYEVAFYNIMLNSATAAPQVFLFSCPDPNICATTPPVPPGGTAAAVAAVASPTLGVLDPRDGFSWTLAGDVFDFINGRPMDFPAPYVQSWSLGIQRQLGQSSVLEVRYVGTKANGLFESVQINPNVTRYLSPQTVSSTDAGSGAPILITLPAQPQVVPANLGICNDPAAPGFGAPICQLPERQVRDRINSARSIYHALQTRFDFRNWRNQLTGGVGWTWSHNIDTVSEIFQDPGTPAFAQNWFDLQDGERGNSGTDLRHTVAINAVWDLPWHQDQNGLLGKIAGGWEATGFALLYTGRVWTPDQFFGGGAIGRLFGFGGQNPFCSNNRHGSIAQGSVGTTCLPHISNADAPISSVGIYRFVNGTLTLLDLAQLNQGNLVPVGGTDVHWILNNAEAIIAGLPIFGANRNLSTSLGDGTTAINLGVFKNTYANIGERRVNFQFRLVLVNAFNHRNYGFPAEEEADFDPGFGFGDFRNNNAIGRRIRFGLRIVF
ncbi:TonB-dependent receptor, partial [Acidobacteriia bacterium AH_259_A11_L15]|nr:TonB-dependent receptor [Acidobacteriia bacterium AH_259_A11_L15]